MYLAKCTISEAFSAILFLSEHDCIMSVFSPHFCLLQKISPKEDEKVLKEIV